ncbi:MAG TPA: hypothetical protein VF062_22370 [Candidatus Limnocylindrales bacterium]
MPYTKCTYTLSDDDVLSLARAADREGTNRSEIVRRCITLRDTLIDAVDRMADEQRGRYIRVAILPEGVDAPHGAEVMRLRLTGPRYPDPERTAPTPRAAKPAAEPAEIDLRLHHANRTVRTDERGDVILDDQEIPLVVSDRRTACGRPTDPAMSTGNADAVTCDACLDALMQREPTGQHR